MNFLLSDTLPQAVVFLITFAVCFISGILPVMVVELFLISVSALSSPVASVVIILIAATAQIMAKLVVYLTGYGILKLPLRRQEEKLERVLTKFQHWKAKPPLFIFVSGLSGLPPFYGVSLFAGLIKVPPLSFVLSGFLGLLVRFALVVQFPQVVIRIFG